MTTWVVCTSTFRDPTEGINDARKMWPPLISSPFPPLLNSGSTNGQEACTSQLRITFLLQSPVGYLFCA